MVTPIECAIIHSFYMLYCIVDLTCGTCHYLYFIEEETDTCRFSQELKIKQEVCSGQGWLSMSVQSLCAPRMSSTWTESLLGGLVFDTWGSDWACHSKEWTSCIRKSSLEAAWSHSEWVASVAHIFVPQSKIPSLEGLFVSIYIKEHEACAHFL